jgi:hypothetical protein
MDFGDCQRLRQGAKTKPKSTPFNAKIKRDGSLETATDIQIRHFREELQKSNKTLESVTMRLDNVEKELEAIRLQKESKKSPVGQKA